MIDRMVVVCSACFCASCWHGDFMCDDARIAGVVSKPVVELDQLKREHPDNYSEKRIKEIYGA
jgi:hypothetical protein